MILSSQTDLSNERKATLQNEFADITNLITESDPYIVRRKFPLFCQRVVTTTIKIFNVWVTKVCLSFSLKCSFQIIENTKVKNSLFFCLFDPNIFKSMFFSINLGELLLPYHSCTRLYKNILKKNKLWGTWCSWNRHWTKIFGPCFGDFQSYQMGMI